MGVFVCFEMNKSFSDLARIMVNLNIPPQLPRLAPIADPCALHCLNRIIPMSQLPPPALATWGRLVLVRFYNAHQDMKQDLLKKRKRGVCTIRFRNHCERIPQRLRHLYNIDVPAEGGPGGKQNGRVQSAVCRRIDELLSSAMSFWGSACLPCAASECECW